MNSKYSRTELGFFLYHQSLASFKWIIHGFSLRYDPRTGQELSLGFNEYQPREVVENNRKKFLQGISNALATDGVIETSEGDICTTERGGCLVTLQQIHSDCVYSFPSDFPKKFPVAGDGLITNQTGLLLSVQTADCLPVLMVDPEKRVVGAVHAGWRGILKGIVEKTVAKMQTQFSSKPAQCLAVVGPAIRCCCYEVGDEVVKAFHAKFDYASALFQSQSTGRNTLDLALACQYQLLCSGLPADHIFADPPCTSCHTDQFFSHRAEGGKTGRMMTVIGLRSNRPGLDK